MKELKALALAVCVISLSACETMDGIMADFDSLSLPSLEMTDSSSENLIYQGKCPGIEVVKDLSTVSEFTDLSDPGDYNLISRANIGRLNAACSYNEHSVTVDLKMSFEGVLGPRGRKGENDKPFFSYPFFVAVTEPGGDILAKEIFAASMTYEIGQNRQSHYETLRQVIPVRSQDRGARYRVLIGFQLNPDQLAYNRQQLKEDKLMMDAQQLQPTQFEAQTQQASEQNAQQLPASGTPVDIIGQ